MKFWLSKNSEISLREQIARQVVLAIIARDIRAGEKLPSVREMALRYNIHANTVSAAYIWLESEAWVKSRQGSGVFVAEKSRREIESAASNSEAELDRLILQFVQTARTRGFALEQIAARWNAKVKHSQINQISIIEPDAELRKILAGEIQLKINLPITEMNLENFKIAPDAIVVALAETFAKISPTKISSTKISSGTLQYCLRLNSVQNEMRGKQRPLPGELIGVVSGWETFLLWSKTMLVAAGVAHEQIVMRNTREENWTHGLSSCAFVIADALTAKKLPPNIDARVFRLITEESLSEIQLLVD